MNINVFYIIYLYVPAVNEKKEAINMKIAIRGIRVGLEEGRERTYSVIILWSQNVEEIIY